MALDLAQDAGEHRQGVVAAGRGHLVEPGGLPGCPVTLETDAHSRLVTCCLTLRFTEIVVGSTLGPLAWAYGGWPTMIAVGATATAGVLAPDALSGAL
ncbi:hypothetical protein [Kitasatospora sp. NPDC056273]|uniref:hypothetical protein n=1 Tax=Kitasatospora sp. NPDC056273 TaxID=3345769 RepID=UPI0035DB7ED2